MSTPRWYVVLSPPYWYTEPILDDGSGPRTMERDFRYVRARKVVRAKVLALRAWRREFKGREWRHDYLISGENPFRGMKTFLATMEDCRDV